MKTSLIRALPLAAAALFTLSGVAHAETVKLWGTFAAEGTAMSSGTGKMTGSIDTKTHMLTYKLTWSGLSGPLTAAHFHGPAAPGESSKQHLVDIDGPFKSGMSRTVKISEDVQKNILDGMSYVNLHTAKYPGGEVRAQVMSKKDGMMKMEEKKSNSSY